MTVVSSAYRVYDKSLDESISRPQTLSSNKILITLCLATFCAFFDWTIYIFLSDSLTKTFFPQTGSSLATQLQFVGLFASGFLARPFGAWLIGHIGNKRGRKPALQLTMSIFLGTTLLVPFLPSYHQIGVLAPLLLVAIRLAQGFAFGGQSMMGWIYGIESLPRRNLAFSIGCITASFAFAAMACGTLNIILASLLTKGQFISYGWRIAFVISALFSTLAFVYVRKLPETKLFLTCMTSSKRSAEKELSQNNIRPNNFNAYLITMFMTLMATSVMITISLLFPKLLLLRFGIDVSLLKIANIVGMLSMAVGMVFYGWLADKFKVSLTLMIGSAILAVQTYLFYIYLSRSSGEYILYVYGILGLTSGVITLCPFIFVRLFKTYNRLPAVSMTYNLTTILTGVALPYSLFYLTDFIAYAPALYIVFICICALILGFFINQSPELYELESVETVKVI